jgi:hypothetical protein
VITIPRGDYTARSKRLHCSISVKRVSKYLTHLPYGFHRSFSRGFYHNFAYAHLAHLASRESFIALYPRAQHALLPPRTPLRLMAETTIAGIQPALPYYALTPHTNINNNICETNNRDRDGTSQSPPPLESVQATFTAYGLSRLREPLRDQAHKDISS